MVIETSDTQCLLLHSIMVRRVSVPHRVASGHQSKSIEAHRSKLMIIYELKFFIFIFIYIFFIFWLYFSFLTNEDLEFFICMKGNFSVVRPQTRNSFFMSFQVHLFLGKYGVLTHLKTFLCRVQQ